MGAIKPVYSIDFQTVSCKGILLGSELLNKISGPYKSKWGNTLSKENLITRFFLRLNTPFLLIIMYFYHNWKNSSNSDIKLAEQKFVGTIKAPVFGIKKSAVPTMLCKIRFAKNGMLTNIPCKDIAGCRKPASMQCNLWASLQASQLMKWWSNICFGHICIFIIIGNFPATHNC